MKRGKQGQSSTQCESLQLPSSPGRHLLQEVVLHRSCAALGHTGALFTSHTSAMGLVSQAEERKAAVAGDAHISLTPQSLTSAMWLDLWLHPARPYLLGV